MNKQIITVFFLLTWLCQLSDRYFVMLEFFLNQDYIAQNLCENRDKPKMHCNGKCHLTKQLKETDRKNQENPERRNDNKSEYYYVSLAFSELTSKYIFINSPQYHRQTIGCPVDHSYGFFHPPTV